MIVKDWSGKEVKLGVDMKAYNVKGDLIEFRLRETRSKFLGGIYSSSSDKFKVLGNLGISVSHRYPLFLIEFESGVRLITLSVSIPMGTIKNPYHPSLLGVGYMGQGIYRSTEGGVHTKEYEVWKKMFSRCYDVKTLQAQPSYIGCSVDSRWCNFQSFCEDIQNLDGYKAWKGNTTPRKYALDKDIKVKGNKIYSKDTCMFVTAEENLIERNLTGKTYLATFGGTGYTEEFHNISKFANGHNLSNMGISRCLSGLQRQYKGWIFEEIK